VRFPHRMEATVERVQSSTMTGNAACAAVVLHFWILPGVSGPDARASPRVQESKRGTTCAAADGPADGKTACVSVDPSLRCRSRGRPVRGALFRHDADAKRAQGVGVDPCDFPVAESGGLAQWKSAV